MRSLIDIFKKPKPKIVPEKILHIFEVYRDNPLMREWIDKIMKSRKNLKRKRDDLQVLSWTYLERTRIGVKFTMADVRELHYLVNPNDPKAKGLRPSFEVPGVVEKPIEPTEREFTPKEPMW